MKYDFRVGDYVEDATGRVGYIQSICQCEQCKARGFYELFVLYTDGNSDCITVYEYERGFPGYKRIGQYDFTKKAEDKDDDKIEPLDYTERFIRNSTVDSTLISYMKKINELVEAVNELRMRDAKESKNG